MFEHITPQLSCLITHHTHYSCHTPPHHCSTSLHHICPVSSLTTLTTAATHHLITAAHHYTTSALSHHSQQLPHTTSSLQDITTPHLPCLITHHTHNSCHTTPHHCSICHCRTAGKLAKNNSQVSRKVNPVSEVGGLRPSR